MHPLFALVAAKLAQLDAAHAARAAEVAEAEEAARGRATPLAAVEDLLRIVLEDLDGGVPGGGDRHRNPLLQASVAVPGRRPAILDAEFLRDLDALRALRHRVPHDHGLRPDPRLLAAHWTRLDGVRVMLGAALDGPRAGLDPPGPTRGPA